MDITVRSARRSADPPVDPPPQRPNGSAAAALLAAGIGSAALGLDVILAESSQSIADAFTLYAPAGSLTGKTTFAVAIWLGSWALLHALTGDRQVNLRPWLRASMILVGFGLLTTFPPFFLLFAS
ncbi:MAG: hypothetical protein ACRD0K_08975 [Egibacteraceae bacterium]